MPSPTLMALLVVALAAHFAGASIVDTVASTQPGAQARMGRKLLDPSAQTLTAAEKLELATKAFKAQGARLAALMQKQQADGAPQAEVEATLKEWTAWVGKATTLQTEAQEVTKTAAQEEGVAVSADAPPADPIAAFFAGVSRQGTALVQSVQAEVANVNSVMNNMAQTPGSFFQSWADYTANVAARIAAIGYLVNNIIVAPKATRGQLIQDAVNQFRQAAEYQSAVASCRLAMAFGSGAAAPSCQTQAALDQAGAAANPFVFPLKPGKYKA